MAASEASLVLDTSAIIAYLANEKGSAYVSEVLLQSKIPFICLSELYYLIWQKKGRAEADRIYGRVKNWNLPVIYPHERIILNAGRIKALYKLGISDSYVAACALEEDSELITKDRDYLVLKEELKILLL